MADTFLNWQRPESAKYPSIWRRFEWRDPTNNNIVRKFRIQDIPEDLFEPILDHMKNNFMLDEPTCVATKLVEDMVSMQEICYMYLVKVLPQKVGLVCFEEGPDGEVLKENGVPIIVGCNLTAITTKSDNEGTPAFSGKAVRTMFGALLYVGASVNIFEKYGVDAYMTALGLSVSREYRGKGIGLQLLLARQELGKALGIKATSTLFTAVSSQKLAERANFELLLEKSYEELEKEVPAFTFPGIVTKSMKVMARRLD